MRAEYIGTEIRTGCGVRVDDLEVHVTRFILGLQPNLQEQYDKFRAYELAQGSMMCRSLPEIFNFLNSLEAVKARVQEQRTTEESDEDGVSMKGSIDTHEQADDEGYRDVEDEAASASDDEKVAEEEAVTVGFIARLQGNKADP